MSDRTETVITHSVEETHDLARRLVEESTGRLVLALHGQLGGGKTCFVQGIAEALGIGRPVTSPTFIIINEYPGPRPLYHIDLYRINSPDEALTIGLEDYLDSDGITAIEWAERVEELLPADAVHIHFETLEQPDSRRIRIEFPQAKSSTPSIPLQGAKVRSASTSLGVCRTCRQSFSKFASSDDGEKPTPTAMLSPPELRV